MIESPALRGFSDLSPEYDSGGSPRAIAAWSPESLLNGLDVPRIVRSR